MGEHCHDIAPLFKVGSHEGQVFSVTDWVWLAELVEVDTNPHRAAVDNDPDYQQYLPRVRAHVILFLCLKIIAHKIILLKTILNGLKTGLFASACKCSV